MSIESLMVIEAMIAERDTRLRRIKQYYSKVFRVSRSFDRLFEMRELMKLLS